MVADLLLDIVGEIRVIKEECTSILFTLTELIRTVGIPSSRLLNDADFNAEIDE